MLGRWNFFKGLWASSLFLLNTIPVQAGQTAASDQASLPDGVTIGAPANDLSSALAAYVEKLQKAVDESLVQSFWKFGINAADGSDNWGTVELGCTLSPSGRFTVQRVLSNTSERIFAYVAQDAVREACQVAFPPELVRYVPNGLSMEIGFTYQDLRGATVPQSVTEFRVIDPSRLKDRRLNLKLTSRGLGTHIGRVRALPGLASRSRDGL